MIFFSRKPTISAVDAAAALARRELQLVDVRRRSELRGGQVRGAINIPLGELSSRLDELDGDRSVAFLCHSGTRSSRATGIAINAGYEAVNVRGGMIAWTQAGLPVTR
jgi:rhodanese-related sulfurtransferase